MHSANTLAGDQFAYMLITRLQMKLTHLMGAAAVTMGLALAAQPVLAGAVVPESAVLAGQVSSGVTQVWGGGGHHGGGGWHGGGGGHYHIYGGGGNHFYGGGHRFYGGNHMYGGNHRYGAYNHYGPYNHYGNWHHHHHWGYGRGYYGWGYGYPYYGYGYGGGSCFDNCIAAGYGPGYCTTYSANFC